MDPEGHGVTRITDSFATDTWPAWSPDGQFIVFQADRNSVNDDIYALFNHTNVVTRLTTTGGADQSPVWSPDGTRIAFTSFRDGNFEIYVMNFDIKTALAPVQKNITNNPAADGRPSWSNNGRQICWMSNRGGNNDIWIMNADGSDPKRLTTDPAADDFCSIK
jgi:TolB protein